VDDFRFYRWLDACLQPASIIAVLFLPLVWSVVFYEIAQDRNRAAEQGERAAVYISRLLENHVFRTIKRTDESLLALQRSYPRQGERAALIAWLRNAESIDAVDLAFLDPHGIVTASSRGAVPPADHSDRDYFQRLAATTRDDLYVSRPFAPRRDGTAAVRVARRVTNPDGSFAGVIAATFANDFLDGFYATVDRINSPTIALIGIDGALRAGAGPGITTDGTTIRSPVVDARLLNAAQSSTAGVYWTRSAGRMSAAHLVAYRVVEDYPFFVAAGLAGGEVFASHFHSEAIYLAAGWIITLALAIAAFLATSRELKFKTAAKSLAETNARFTASLQNMPHGLCMFDRDLRLVMANERYAAMYGLSSDFTVPGTTLLAVLQERVRLGSSPVDGEGYIQGRLRDVARQEPLQLVSELRDGRTIAVDCQPMPGGGFVAIHQDITPQKQSEAKIAYLAHHDPLTGLLNRASLLERINENLAYAYRHDSHFALLLLDLDRFKQVNDSYGHPAGDALLQQVAMRLKAEVRQTDVLARLGGDEFAIIQAAEVDPYSAAAGLAARLVEIFARPFTIDRNEVSVGTSIGIAISTEHVTSAGRLMKMADLALYQTKAQGRNRFSFFDPSLEEAASERNALETDLRHAVTQGDFVLYYQPILNARTGRITGAEALIRWPHPVHGWVGPDRFIPLAEESGLISEIGQWVLRTACADAAAWPADTKVAVNISAVQLRDPMIVDYVICALAESGLPPERLELEITETALINSGLECHAILRQFKALGVTIALDDFGTGYSSLSQLTMFPFDKIKIDKSFTSNMTSRADCAAIIAGVLALAKSLDIETTAEGVETKQQYRLLRLAGVSGIQGYLIKRPGPASELDFATAFNKEEGARVA
jgi:diguanylate cyclase (GGDEF)-like protein/PAS domain S-box-containing protein